MRRMLLMLFMLLSILPAAQADETWTEIDWLGETVTWTRTDTAWGSITYAVSESGEDWLPCFRCHGLEFTPEDEFVAAFDPATGMQSFYLTDEWCYDPDDRDSFVVLAEKLLTSGELAFQYDTKNSRLLLPGFGEADMPEGATIVHAYIRSQRMFMTIDAADGYLLRIVTWRDGLDVRDIAIPWPCSFDSYHASNDGDSFFLWLDVHEDFGGVGAACVDGRWLLTHVNTGTSIFDLQDYAIYDDIDGYWAYGTHPWHDIETMDWNTLPLTAADATHGQSNEGWRFPTENVPLRTAPDANADVLEIIPADMPLCVIRTEGDWALAGVQTADYDSRIGYFPVSILSDMPQSVIPGGELYGWFCTMTVENDVLTFAPVAGFYDTISIAVQEGFAEAARAVYREKGYAATPVGFDPSLLPYLLYDSWLYTLRDAVVTEGTLLLSIYNSRSEEHLLRCVTDAVEPRYQWTELVMPGPFHFDRENISDWSIGITMEED